jgi:gentisate 1,2-dioxygenase
MIINNAFAILSTSALSTLLRQDPTPVPTDAVVYSVVSAEGQATVAMTVFQITTGDILISMLLVVIAVLLLCILITLIWRRNA